MREPEWPQNYAGNDERSQGVPRTTPASKSYKWDVADFDACVAGIKQRSKAKLGPVDVIVNNAGINRDGTIEEDETGAAWKDVMDTNLGGCFNMCRRPGDGICLDAQIRPGGEYRLDQRPGWPVWPGQLRRRQIRHPRRP